MTLDDCLASRYKDGGRGPHEYDCWGLTRTARHEMFSKPLLPSYGDISANDKRGLTIACFEVGKGMEKVGTLPGSIVTAWRGRVCAHIALVVSVDGKPMVLETNEATGPQLTALRKFESRFSRVIFYD